jgi:glycosyltransferase involved in cell wall biosynthesis
MKQKTPNICLVALFSHEAFFNPLSHMRTILSEVNPDAKTILTITPGLTDKLPVNPEKDDIIIYQEKIKPWSRILNYILLNMRISWRILFRSKGTDCFIFFIQTGLLLPMIAGKLRNKKILWLLPSSLEKMIAYDSDLTRNLIFLQEFSYRVADNIIVYSPNLVKEWNLQKYSDKILIAHEHFIDTNAFSITTALSDRPVLIGFIGRLSEEKGILNFIRALPILFEHRNDIRIFIGGNGPCRGKVEEFLQMENLTNQVTLAGWIFHDDLPKYLNNLKLLVIPSYTEGLPNTMLEAICCGMPIVTIPVGAIPDFIKEGETGYIMENSSPECIAENIIRALDDPDLENIALNAKTIIENEFSFENTVEMWNKLLDEICT